MLYALVNVVFNLSNRVIPVDLSNAKISMAAFIWSVSQALATAAGDQTLQVSTPRFLNTTTLLVQLILNPNPNPVR